jgi:hypothetical protein
MATCAPVWNELVFGGARLPASRKRLAIERYLADVVAPTLWVLPYDAVRPHGMAENVLVSQPKGALHHSWMDRSPRSRW